MVGGSCSVNQAEEKRKLALKTTMSLQMAGVVFFWKSYLFNGSTNLFSLFFYSLQLHPNYFSLAVIKIHRYNLDEKRSIRLISFVHKTVFVSYNLSTPIQT